jgi:hypothetical protein
VWCAAFDSQPTGDEIKERAFATSAPVADVAVAVVVTGLEAFTPYDIYCYGEDRARPAHTTADR